MRYSFFCTSSLVEQQGAGGAGMLCCAENSPKPCQTGIEPCQTGVKPRRKWPQAVPNRHQAVPNRRRPVQKWRRAALKATYIKLNINICNRKT